MDKNTILFLVGLGAAYFFLTSRQPVFQQMPDGSYQPATAIDRLTVSLTGVQPPQASQRSVSLDIPGLFDATYSPTGASSIKIG